MATDPMAQDLIRCDLCPGKDRKSPVELVCKTCSINLCSECVGSHLTSELSIRHDVVGFVFGRFEMPSVSCEIHRKSSCELHCQDCSVPVCAKCLAGVTHKNHDLVEISSLYGTQKEAIKQDTGELTTIITPTYEKIYQDLETQKTELPVGYGDLRKIILKQGKQWHEELDIIINKKLTMVEKMEKDDLSLLIKLQSEITDILSSIRDTIEENHKYLKSHIGPEVMNYKSRNEEFRKVPATFEISLPYFLPMKIQEEQLSHLFGEIRPSKIAKVPGYSIQTADVSASSAKEFPHLPKVEKTVPCNSWVALVCCVPNTEELYIKHDETITHVDNKGTVLNEFKIKSGKPDVKLTVTRDRKLVYSDVNDRSINMINHDKIETIVRLNGWNPLAVSSTSSDELLVSMVSDDRKKSKVVRYKQSTVTQEIQYDTASKPLYSWPHYLTENKNLQICVSNYGSNTVVVTDKAGNLEFKYKGNLSSKEYKTFSPRGIATDSACRILVADFDNKCVHIINHEGEFMRYIDGCNLYKIWDLSVSHNDLLYIADRQKSVKVIKYVH